MCKRIQCRIVKSAPLNDPAPAFRPALMRTSDNSIRTSDRPSENHAEKYNPHSPRKAQRFPLGVFLDVRA
jgi:hypothetical protein